MIRPEDILSIIPARGGSKGVPRKNIRELDGKPLIAHTIEAALGSGYINRLMVSTDDEEIADISQKWGADVPFLRPVELATDTAKAIAVVKHALLEMEMLEMEMRLVPPLQDRRSAMWRRISVQLFMPQRFVSCL